MQMTTERERERERERKSKVDDCGRERGILRRTYGTALREGDDAEHKCANADCGFIREISKVE